MAAEGRSDTGGAGLVLQTVRIPRPLKRQGTALMAAADFRCRQSVHPGMELRLGVTATT